MFPNKIEMRYGELWIISYDENGVETSWEPAINDNLVYENVTGSHRPSHVDIRADDYAVTIYGGDSIHVKQVQIWICLHCECCNPEDFMVCGEGKPYGCGAPRPDRRK